MNSFMSNDDSKTIEEPTSSPPGLEKSIINAPPHELLKPASNEKQELHNNITNVAKKKQKKPTSPPLNVSTIIDGEKDTIEMYLNSKGRTVFELKEFDYREAVQKCRKGIKIVIGFSNSREEDDKCVESDSMVQSPTKINSLEENSVKQNALIQKFEENGKDLVENALKACPVSDVQTLTTNAKQDLMNPIVSGCTEESYQNSLEPVKEESFTSKKDIYKDYEPKQIFNCQICKKQFIGILSFHKHIRAMLNESYNHSFEDFKKLYFEIGKATMPYFCETCYYRFATVDDLNYHEYSDNSYYSYCCPRFKNDIEKEIKESRTPKLVSCPQCEKVCSIRDLFIHYFEHAPFDRPEDINLPKHDLNTFYKNINVKNAIANSHLRCNVCSCPIDSIEDFVYHINKIKTCRYATMNYVYELLMEQLNNIHVSTVNSECETGEENETCVNEPKHLQISELILKEFDFPTMEEIEQKYGTILNKDLKPAENDIQKSQLRKFVKYVTEFLFIFQKYYFTSLLSATFLFSFSIPQLMEILKTLSSKAFNRMASDIASLRLEVTELTKETKGLNARLGRAMKQIEDMENALAQENEDEVVEADVEKEFPVFHFLKERMEMLISNGLKKHYNEFEKEFWCIIYLLNKPAYHLMVTNFKVPDERTIRLWKEETADKLELFTNVIGLYYLGIKR